METFSESDEMKKLFEELEITQHSERPSSVSSSTEVTERGRNNNYNNDRNSGSFRSQFDPSKMKEFTKVTIPDDDSGKYGVYIKTYKYDNNSPKVKVGRYGLKTKNVNPDDNNKYYEKDGIAIDLSRPDQIKEIGEALVNLAKCIVQKPEQYKYNSPSV